MCQNVQDYKHTSAKRFELSKEKVHYPVVGKTSASTCRPFSTFYKAEFLTVIELLLRALRFGHSLVGATR